MISVHSVHRVILATAATAAATISAATLAAQPPLTGTDQAYPTKPIRLIQPFPPGGGTDAIGRILQTKLSDALGQPIVMDHRPGASGSIAAEIVARSAADGYTLFMGFSTVLTTNKSLYKKVAFDPIKDFAPIIQLATGQYMLIVHPSVAAKSVSELVALAKAKPGSVNYASAGIGSPQHLAGELFKSRAGVSIVHVAYKGGGPAATAALAGETQMVFGSVAASLQQVKADRLRALGVTGLKRSLLAPELPTLHESGFTGFNVSNWHSFVAPAGTPPAVIRRIHAESTKALRAPDTGKLINSMGYEITGTTPEQLADIIAAESALWAKVIKEANIRAE